MTYQEILNKYYIIAPIERNDVKILLCKNIKTHSYAFFTLKNNNYEFVDKSLEDELKKTYRNDTGDIYYINIDSSLIENKNIILDAFNDNKNILEKFIEKTSILTKIICMSNLEKLEFRKENNIDNEIAPKKILAYYRSTNNTIYFKNESSGIDKHILMHEMIHCASKSNNFSLCGLRSLASPESLTDETNRVLFYEGSGMTEGGTEFYASMLLDEPPISYRFQCNIFKNLRDVCNKDKLDLYFFSARPDLFKQHISNVFCYDNDYMINKLFAKIDTLNLLRHDKNNLKERREKAIVIEECYKTLITMYVNKYKKEKISLDDKQLFKDIISLDFIKEHNLFKEQLEKNLNAFYFLSIININQSINKKDEKEKYNLICSNIILNLINNKEINIDEDIKNMHFYNKMLSCWSIANDKIDSNSIKNKLYKVLFSKNNLPKDPIILEKLITRVLADGVSFNKYEAHKYFPEKTLAEYLNKRPNYSVMCFSERPLSFMPKHICYFSDEIKTNSIFKNSFKNCLATLSPKTANKIVSMFYNKLSECLKADKDYCNFLISCIDPDYKQNASLNKLYIENKNINTKEDITLK